MNRAALTGFLKVGIVFAFLACAGLCIAEALLPYTDAAEYMLRDPASMRLPCIAIGVAMLIPIVLAFIAFWKVVDNIARDKSFCADSAKRMKQIGLCAAVDLVLSLGAFAVLLVGLRNRLGVCLAELVVFALGFVTAAAAFLLSGLIAKASSMQEEIDLTV
ncbi:MAG TPA: DUF2975 domain-containing protein [Eubacteriales bacterium]|nr:DUF2975 domain-containing protein [Clostridia bacterium]HRV72991.1 DUF2975 domain-containing protein [Eubacteriales bacterium]